MAEPEKRQLGLFDLSLGAHSNFTLGATYFAQERVTRVADMLTRFLAGQMAIEEYRSLMGMLVNMSFLTDMSRSATHGMYMLLSADGLIRHGPATVISERHIEPLVRQKALRWRDSVSASCGAPFTAAVRSLSMWMPSVPATQRVYWRSDSCKEGTTTPGIAGVRSGTSARHGFVRCLPSRPTFCQCR